MFPQIVRSAAPFEAYDRIRPFLELVDGDRTLTGRSPTGDRYSNPALIRGEAALSEVLLA
jgi:hypothetical protein